MGVTELLLFDRIRLYENRINLYRKAIVEDIIELVNENFFKGIGEIYSVPEKQEAFGRLQPLIFDVLDFLFCKAIIIHNRWKRLQKGERVGADWFSSIPDILIKDKQEYEEKNNT